MSEQWPTVRLGDVLCARPTDINVEPERIYQFAGVKSFGGGVFRSVQRAGSEFSYRLLTTLRTGDLVYPKLMAWEGAIAVVPPECDGCVVSPEFPVFAARHDMVMARFLEAFFQSFSGRQLLLNSSSGTNVRRRRVHPSRFEALEVSLPPLREQRRIVARIDELAAHITEARTLCKQVAEEAESLLTCMAHRRDLTVVAKDALGWRRVPLGSCVKFVDDSHQVAADRRYPNLGIYSFGKGLFHKPAIDGATTSATTLRRAKVGQFIYSRLFAFEGAYGMVTDEYDGHFVSAEYPTFDCDPRSVRPEFLRAYFKARSVWSEVAVGSKGLGDRRQRVQPAQILSHQAWIPPLTWQDRIAAIQAEVDALKRLQAESAAELDALLPSILDRAFKGEL